MAKLNVVWKRSAIGCPQRQRRTIEALGLKRLNQTVTHDDTPQVRGMIHAVSHLVEWTEEK